MFTLNGLSDKICLLHFRYTILHESKFSYLFLKKQSKGYLYNTFHISSVYSYKDMNQFSELWKKFYFAPNLLILICLVCLIISIVYLNLTKGSSTMKHITFNSYFVFPLRKNDWKSNWLITFSSELKSNLSSRNFYILPEVWLLWILIEIFWMKLIISTISYRFKQQTKNKKELASYL